EIPYVFLAREGLGQICVEASQCRLEGLRLEEERVDLAVHGTTLAQISDEATEHVEVEPEGEGGRSIDLSVMLETSHRLEAERLPIESLVMRIDGDAEVFHEGGLDRVDEHHPDQPEQDGESRLLVGGMHGQSR